MASPVVNAMLQTLAAISKLAESAKTAEKSRVASIKAEAAKLFAQQYASFQKMQTVSNSSSSGAVSPFHAELQVVVAEVAFATESQAISRRVLETFLQTSPQKDQYYCRAKTLLGLLIEYEASATNGITGIQQRKLALAELMLALDVATSTENVARYKFVVFNISVACWQIVSPFLRADRARNFIAEMNRVSSALEAIDDADKKWRISYLAATAVCYADDKQAKEASDRLDKACEHAEKLLADVLSVDAGLAAEAKKCTSETEAIMAALREVEDREEAKNRKPKIDPDAEEGTETKTEQVEFPPLEGLAALGYVKLKERLNESQGVKAASEEKLKTNGDLKQRQQEALTRLYSQRVHVNVPDFKKVQGMPSVAASVRMRTLVQLQCMVSNAIVDKDWPATFAAIIADLEKAPRSGAIAETFLDVSRAAWSLNQRATAIACCEKAEGSSAASPALRVKLDLCQSIRIVADIAEESAHKVYEQRLTAKQVEGYAASRRIEAIKLLERTLTMCTGRLEDDALTQEICVAIWNTALLLLQPHLRANIHCAFQLAAAALEACNSSLTQLRAQLHFEVAKCEESTDFLARAKDEGDRALACDYGLLDAKLLPNAASDLDRNRALDHLIGPMVRVLDMRTSVYDAPSDPEGQVTLLVQQIKESSSKAFQKDSLGKAMALMMVAVDGELGGDASASAGATVMGATGTPASLPDQSVADMEAYLTMPRSSDYAIFTTLLQQRVGLMSLLAQLALGLHNLPVLVNAVKYVLGRRLDPLDAFMRPLIDRQIDCHFLLANALIEKIAGMWIDPEQEKLYEQDLDARQAADPEILDPRLLGIVSKYSQGGLHDLKRVVILALRKGIELSVTIKDEYGVQNGVIYFWNLHLHVFRNELFAHAMPEVLDFLTFAVKGIDALPSSNTSPAGLASTTNPLAPSAIDGRLKLSLLEGLSSLHAAQGAYPQAIEISTKASMCAESAYIRKRAAELVSKQVLLAAAAGAPAGAKGAAKSAELPKFDSPFLLVYSALAQAELPASALPPDQVQPLLDKALGLMETEVSAYLQSLNWADMAQEAYDQQLELQAEAWTRLCRAKIRQGDIHGSQQMAEKCMALIAEGIMKEAEQQKLSPRVWRWVSVCERYFGMAITRLIQPEGQDLALQSELLLASLRHFSLSADYGHRAAKEDLVVSAAIDSWNASIPLLDTASSTVRETLSFLQRQMLDYLLRCKAEEDGLGPVCQLTQQLFLGIIAGHAAGLDWDATLSVVNEAFEYVPAALQKPLWKWRVVATSKRGKDVLAALSKLKEGAPSLQARVYAILARASSNPTQQLEAYRKTIEILKDDMERIDYMLETAQWLASAGVPRAEITEVVQSALDAIYEVEEKNLIAPLEEGNEEGSQTSTMSRASNRSGGSGGGPRTAQKTPGRSTAGQGSRGGGGGGGGGGSAAGASRAGSRVGTRIGTEHTGILGRLEIPGGVDGALPAKLNTKQYEQSLRALIMLAMLESNEAARRERLAEAVYFVRALLEDWQSLVYEACKCAAYAKMPLLEHEATLYDTYVLPDEAYDGLSIPSSDVFMLLDWVPSERFVEIMGLITAEQPLQVPSSASLPCLPLTLHYLMWAVQALEQQSMSKTSLLLLGLARALIVSIPLDDAAQQAALAMLHFRTMLVAANAGLDAEGFKLRPQLGRSEVTSAAFVQNFALKPFDAAAVVPLELTASEQLSAFGFSSYTSALSTLDPLRCGLDIAESLLALGQLTLGRGVALALMRDFSIKQWPRERLQAATLLAQMDLMQGRLSQCLAAVLSSAAMMRECGDAGLIMRHTLLACTVYLRTARGPEARRVVLDAIETLQTFCHIQVQPTAMQESMSVSLLGSHRGSQDLLEKQDTGALTCIKSTPQGSRSPSRGGTGARKGRVTDAVAPSERSFETLHALREVLFLFLDMLTAEAAAQAQLGKDPRPALSEAMDRCDKLLELSALVAGRGSLFAASVLEKKSRAAYAMLCLVHQYASGSVGLSPSAYAAFLTASLQACLDWQGEAADIRRGLLAQISLEDQSYTPAYVAPPAPVPEPAAKGAKGAPPPVTEAPPPQVAQTKLLSLSLQRAAAAGELLLAELNLAYARLHGHDIAAVAVIPSDGTNAIERYLIETTQPDLFVPEDFALPPLYKTIQLSGSAIQLLSSCFGGAGIGASTSTSSSSSVGSVSNASHSDAKLMYHSAQLARACAGGAYNLLWREKRAVPPEEEGAAGADAAAANDLTAQFIATRSTLVGLAAEALKRSSVVPSAALAYAATCLVDGFGGLPGIDGVGSAASPARAACFVLLLQSLRARDWLQGVWERSLNPASEVAASLARLKALESSNAPTPGASPQQAAERMYLESSSVAWRRLGVAADPAAIAPRLPLCFLCLAFDPAMRTLYAAAGTAGPAQPDAAGAPDSAFCLPGKWAVDRLELREPQRRIIQALVQQHKAWTDDVSKFVNIYGEQVSADQDLCGCEGRMGGGKLAKTERALEERLRALLADLEGVLAPLLAPESRVGSLLRAEAESGAGACAGAMLLLDPALQALPLDGLAALEPFQGRVARDFSVHMLGHRVTSFIPAAAPPPATGAKGAPPPASSATVTSTKMQCVVDPYGDDAGSAIEGLERQSIDGVYAGICASVPGGAKWSILYQGKGTLSAQDWLLATTPPAVPVDPKNPAGAGKRPPVGLMVYSTGRLGSMISPVELAALDLEAVLMLLCVDQGMTDNAYRRQNVLDNVKSPAEVMLESPLALHALGEWGSWALLWPPILPSIRRFLSFFTPTTCHNPGIHTIHYTNPNPATTLLNALYTGSLGGIGCTVFQRWASTLASQKRFMGLFWAALGPQKTSALQAMAAASLSLCRGGGQAAPAEDPPKLKPWVRLSRVLYGIPTTTYVDA